MSRERQRVQTERGASFAWVCARDLEKMARVKIKRRNSVRKSNMGLRPGGKGEGIYRYPFACEVKNRQRVREGR